MGVARTFQRVRNGVPRPAGSDSPLPSLQASAHAARVGSFFALIQVFLRVAGSCSKVALKGAVHLGCLRASCIVHRASCLYLARLALIVGIASLALRFGRLDRLDRLHRLHRLHRLEWSPFSFWMIAVRARRSV